VGRRFPTGDKELRLVDGGERAALPSTEKTLGTDKKNVPWKDNHQIGFLRGGGVGGIS